MDTIRTLARERHFFTSDLRLAGYGQVLLIGDQKAIEHLVAVFSEHGGHNIVREPDEPRNRR